MVTTKPKYKSSQSELYAMCDAIIASLTTYLALFTAFKAKYSAAFISALQTKLDTARNLPDAQTRLSAAEIKRVELSEENKKMLQMYQLFKRYVVDVYPKALQKATLESAGSSYYNEAANDNWEKGILLGNSAKQFIAANTATLSDGGLNMPAAFPADFDNQYTRFKNKYDEFIPLRQSEEGTEDKIEANNEIYEAIASVCLDGQALFAGDKGKREKFIINSVLEVISPPGAASLRVLVKDAVTMLPLENVRVFMNLPNTPALELLTDENGDVLFTNIPSGTYKYALTLDAYADLTGTKQVNTGTNARLELLMTAL